MNNDYPYSITPAEGAAFDARIAAAATEEEVGAIQAEVAQLSYSRLPRTQATEWYSKWDNPGHAEEVMRINRRR